MTITLAPKTEAMLKENAQREGRDMDTVANDLLDDFLSAEMRERAETVAAIHAGMEAGAAGREKPLKQYIAEQRQKRGLPDTWPSSASATEIAPGVFVALE